MDQIQEYQEQIQKKNEEASREYDRRVETLNARLEQYKNELKQILDQELSLNASLYERKKEAAKLSHDVRMKELEDDLKAAEENFQEKRQDRRSEKEETKDYYSRYREEYASDIGHLKAEIAKLKVSMEELEKEFKVRNESLEKEYDLKIRRMDEEYETFSAECRKKIEAREKELFSEEGTSNE